MKKIAVTGATGFLGRYILRELSETYKLRCWYRPESDRTGLEALNIEWVAGDLSRSESAATLLAGCDGLIHSAIYRPDSGWSGTETDLLKFAEINILGSLNLFQAARRRELGRVVFISTCAVHDKILSDRELDETHPLWPMSHYGALKAALEKFVHSYGMGQEFPICALRPTGIYGAAHPIEDSKWYDLVDSIREGRDVLCNRGSKEVHARDVARAVALLLKAPASAVSGEAFNCYDRYISDYEVAEFLKAGLNSRSKIDGRKTAPKNQISTAKISRLGMTFGGTGILHETLSELIAGVK